MRHGLLPESQIDRNGRFYRRKHRFPCLEVVRRRNDDDIVDRAQRREIVQGMMGGSERTITHPRADSNDFDGSIRVTDVVLDLFERSRSEKAARRNRKDDLACGRKARRDPYQILFSNPYFNDLPRDCLAKRREFPRPSRIAGHHQQIGILVSQFQERGREYF